jgi:hypothetical protein
LLAPQYFRLKSLYSEGRQLTFFLQKYPTFGHHDWNVTIDETFTLIVGKRYCDICISDTFGQGNAEDSSNCNGCSMVSMDDRKRIVPTHGAPVLGKRRKCIASPGSIPPLAKKASPVLHGNAWEENIGPTFFIFFLCGFPEFLPPRCQFTSGRRRDSCWCDHRRRSSARRYLIDRLLCRH